VTFDASPPDVVHGSPKVPGVFPDSAMASGGDTDRTVAAYVASRRAHWDRIATDWEAGKHTRFGGYQHRLRDVYRFLVSPGQRVLELGSGNGDLLASLGPSVGVGLDFSPRMVELARTRHPDIRFEVADATSFDLDGVFDVIILSDLVNDLFDVQAVLQRVRAHCTPRTRVVLNFYSRLWETPLAIARRIGLATPVLQQNWLTREDVANLLHLAGFEVIRAWEEVLWPFSTPVIAPVLNRFFAKLWPFRHLALTNFMLARLPRRALSGPQPKVSVVVAARNEQGNIVNIFARTPELGAGTELIFVEGGSSDDTYAEIERQILRHPDRRAAVYKQSGKGKGDAVRLGFAKATGDVLMILDADLTMPPEQLPRYYEAIHTGAGEFINGVRLVYPMEEQAMRFANLIGNKFFSLAFSWLLGQSIKDTLCGTKVLWREDYERIAANRSYFGEFDPFGDFDLIFGAAKQGLRIVDLPIRYRERTYGDTNIQRWRHGVILLRMVMFAAGRIKFV
jgi:SAM-dependent methyltransferase